MARQSDLLEPAVRFTPLARYQGVAKGRGKWRPDEER